MKIKLLSFTKLVIVAVLASSFQIITLPSSLAVPSGKLAFKDKNYLADDFPTVAYVGILDKNISGRVGIGSSFIPYFKPAINNGAPQDIYLESYSARLAFKITDPSGKEISYKKSYQEITGSGVLRKSFDEKVFQAEPTYGNVVTYLPQIPGTYRITVWHDFNEDGQLDNNEASFSKYSVVDESTNIKLILTNFGKNIGSMTADSIGILTKVCITNNSKPTNLQPNYEYENQPDPKMIEQLIVKTNSTTEVIDAVSKWNGETFSVSENVDAPNYTLTNENFNAAGCAYINHFNTAPNPVDVTLYFYGLGPNYQDLNASVTSRYINATSFPLIAGPNRAVTNAINLSGSYSTVASVTASGTGQPANSFDVYISPNVGTSLTISTKTESGVPGVSGASVAMRVIDTDGKITGLKNASYMYVVGSAVDATDLTVSTSFYASLAESETYKIYVQGSDSLLGGNLTGSVAITVKTQKRTPKILEGKVTRVRQKPGSTAIHYLKLKDQFGELLPNTEINLVTTGRSSSTGKYRTYKSNAYGYIEYISEDVNSDSTLFNDLVSGVDQNGIKLLGNGLIVDFSDFVSPEKITISGGATDETSANSILNYIDTSYAGATNTIVKMTATLTDANGYRLKEGIPVSWSLSGLENRAFIYVEKSLGEDWTTSYTDSQGQAFTYIYSIGTGDVIVNAKSGENTQSNKGLIHFANKITDVRVISAIAGDGYVKAHAEDRYGNPIKNLNLFVKRNSGPGLIPNQGSLQIYIPTNDNGDIYFSIVGGNANYSISTETEKFGQTGSEEGYVDDLSISTSGVGYTYASKGVSKISIDVKSKDTSSESVSASNNAIKASDKAIENSNLAAAKADEALSKTKDTLSKVNELSISTKLSVELIRRQLNELSQVLVKIKRKIK